MAKDAAKTEERAGTVVNRSKVDKDTAQEAHGVGTPVNRSRVARDTTHATQHTERAHR